MRLTSMVLFPNAKVNLGLNIVEKRADGFHNIETCFIPVPWCDVLEFVEAKKTSFQSTGIPIPGRGEDNLCMKAFRLMQKDYGLPNISIHLHKNIPMGAGLGGGSSDAAFLIKALAEKYNLIFESELLKFYASQIGSDCAFFIDNVPSIAREKGDVLSALDVDLKGKFIVVAYPGIHVDTKTAYSGVTPQKPDHDLEKVLTSLPVEEWKGLVKNDFEQGIFEKYPDIEAAKTMLYAQGALYAAMSGSGSAVFGIFSRQVEIESHFPDTYSFWKGGL